MPSKMVEAVRFLGLEIEVLYSQTTLLKAPASEGELCASEIGVAHCLSRGVGHIVEQRDVDHRRKARPGSSGQSDHASPPAPGSSLLSPSKVPPCLVTRRDCCKLEITFVFT